MLSLIQLTYLISTIAFIFGLKLLSSPRTARKGNMLAAAAMLFAVVVTLLDRQILTFQTIVIGMIIGTIIGALFARLIKMTAMPQMVAIFNGFGGGASLVVAAAEYLVQTSGQGHITLNISISIFFSTLIGAVTFTGSLIAFGKLQEVITSRAVTYPLQKILNALLLTAIIGMGIYLQIVPDNHTIFYLLVGTSLLLGILAVIPIGGADMPVVISLLNSYSGLAACATGFVLENTILIVAGSLVGASGIILTRLMCVAMNRSLTNVLFGAFGALIEVPGAAQDGEQRSVKSYTPEDAVIAMSNAQSVVFVPGYGLAVAQAQHNVRELAELLEERDIDVKYAIHPVAGRMPGHMNVLLAEANVPYSQLYDLEQINPEFERTDVVMIVGANDVVNPAARHDKNSPIYGMPILDVDKAGSVIMLKRSLNPGFAGIDNELFYEENTMMVFGDAKKTIVECVNEMKQNY